MDNQGSLGCHYVPQRYLQAFEAVEEAGSIWPFDKLKPEGRRVPIKSVAQSRAFYTDEIERRLNREVELPGSVGIKKLVEGDSLTERERLDLTLYLGTMLLRVPARRSQAKLLLPEAVHRAKKEFLELLQKRRVSNLLSDAEFALQVEKAHAVVEEVILDPPADILERMYFPFPSDRIQDAIYSMTWRVLTTEGPTLFLTSDNPVFIFRAYGLGTQLSELSFPLSPSKSLHGSNQGMRRSLRFDLAKQSFVKEMNRRQISGASRLVLSHERAVWISATVQKSELHLNSIRWH